MKIKVFLFLILMLLFIFLINLSNQDKEIYYVNIDTTNRLKYNDEIVKKIKKDKKLEKYVNYFSKEDYRTTDLINDIENNIKINNQTIQNALIKADILTLYIGENDINYKISNKSDELYNYIDQVLTDIEKLLNLIRKYTKEKIFVISFDNNNDYYEYVNKELQNICNKYDINFVSKKDVLNIYYFKSK